MTEQTRIDEIAGRWSSEEGFNARLIDFRFRIMRPYLQDCETCLELGSADGRMTGALRGVVSTLVAVDGAPAQTARLIDRYPDIEVYTSLFDELDLGGRRFDAVVLGHVLEHVEDPVGLLSLTRDRFLAREGIVITSVPNGLAFHRRLGTCMGILPSPLDFSEADLLIGHRRVYTFESLEEDVRRSGLRPVARHGVVIKPFSNAQMDALPDPVVEGLAEMAAELPELAADLLVVARRAD